MNYFNDWLTTKAHEQLPCVMEGIQWAANSFVSNDKERPLSSCVLEALKCIQTSCLNIVAV